MHCKFYLKNNLNPTKTKVCGSRLIVLFQFYSTICYYGIFCIQLVEFLICGFNNRQFFQTHRAPTLKPLSEGQTIGDKTQPLQSEIPNNARISASSHGWDIGHQPSIA